MTDEIVIEEPVVSSEDQNVLDQDLIELGEKPVSNEPVQKDLTPEEEEDRKEDELHQDRTPEEREAIRERRRIERQEKKRHVREKEDSYRREIETLRNQLQEVNTWKNTVEKRNIHSGIAQIDKGINDASEALELARQAMAQATQEQNGEAFVDAQELYYAARKRGEDLLRVKQTIAQRVSQKPRQNLPDPTVINQVKQWAENKPWYDVSGRDEDSQIVQTIERSVANEGWDPRQKGYWDELDNRLKKYLPHRFNMSYNAGKASSRPPTEGSSTSRPSAGYRLSPERVRAIREAGAWDDPVSRKEMIKAYMDYDKQSR